MRRHMLGARISFSSAFEVGAEFWLQCEHARSFQPYAVRIRLSVRNTTEIFGGNGITLGLQSVCIHQKSNSWLYTRRVDHIQLRGPEVPRKVTANCFDRTLKILNIISINTL